MIKELREALKEIGAENIDDVTDEELNAMCVEFTNVTARAVKGLLLMFSTAVVHGIRLGLIEDPTEEE